jgi:hypothetical protein
MAKDLLQRLQEFRDKAVRDLSDEHTERLVKTLQTLEAEVISQASDLPVRGGKLFDTRVAIAIRPSLKSTIENIYLVQVADNINEYDKIAGNIVAQYGELPLPKEFTELTNTDLELVQQLKKIEFAQFEDLANEFVSTLSDEVYQSSLTGSSRAEMIERLKGKINGIYQSSSDTEAQELVNFVANNPQDTANVATAVSRLQTIYGRDRLGENLRKYTTQIVQDSIMGFDGRFTKYKADQAGLNHYRYDGTIIGDSRPFCIQNLGKVWSEEEIREIWSSQTWKGKSQGDPFDVRGGYNCRHFWTPVNPDWLDAEGNYKLD